MKISVDKDYSLEFEDVFTPLIIKQDKERVSMVARDGGFEIIYDKSLIILKNGVIEAVKTK